MIMRDLTENGPTERMRGRSLQHRRRFFLNLWNLRNLRMVFMVNDKRLAALDVLAWLLLMWLLLQRKVSVRFEGRADLRIHVL